MKPIVVYLEQVIYHKGSDLHLSVGLPPILRIDGALHPLQESALSDDDLYQLINEMLSVEVQKNFLESRELDFSFALDNRARFRVNAFHQQNHPAASLRLIPSQIPSLAELGMPEVVRTFTTLPQGLILITGPTGQGKSTTLAAIIETINQNRTVHIISIEDPIEYVFSSKKALIAQREVYHDTKSWDIALRSILREDPNVVLIGEMRDLETIRSAITIAETGHLVFATLHTNSSSQAIDRMIDVFPEEQQHQVRVQLSSILEGVIGQRLVPKIGGGRMAAVEVMIANSAVRNLIREGKSHQIDNVIITSAEAGMVSLEHSLVHLVKNGLITQETALGATTRPDELLKLITTAAPVSPTVGDNNLSAGLKEE